MIRALLFSAAAALPLTASAGFHEFSIEYEIETGPEAPEGFELERIVYHMSGPRMRIDMHQSGQAMATIMTRDGDQVETTILYPAQKAYMKGSQGMDVGNTELFDLQAGDTNPCTRAETMECQRAGEENLLGYDTTIWRVRADADAEWGRYWYAPALGYPLKIEEPQGYVLTATRVEDSAPADELFEVPADYSPMPGFGGN